MQIKISFGGLCFRRAGGEKNENFYNECPDEDTYIRNSYTISIQ